MTIKPNNQTASHSSQGAEAVAGSPSRCLGQGRQGTDAAPPGGFVRAGRRHRDFAGGPGGKGPPGRQGAPALPV